MLRDRLSGAGDEPTAKKLDTASEPETPPPEAEVEHEWYDLREPDLDDSTARKPDGASEPETPPPKAEVRVPPPEARTPGRPSSVSINLGIDFGTSFTKICFRDVGTEESGVITFDANDAEGAFIPTIVAIGKNGDLWTSDEAPGGQSCVLIPYLKMRLADSTIGDKLPEVLGIDLNTEESVSALSSWFLASVITRSQRWLLKAESDRFRNRVPVWSANVGVPVEHCDSPALEQFTKVLGVAWLWVKEEAVPSNIGELIELYQATEARLDETVSDFHAIPEIAAAVQSFIISREAVPGIYVYFDIGGGTVDGVAFRFLNDDGDRKIDFYSGKVDPIGISVLANNLGAHQSGAIEAEELEEILTSARPATKSEFAQNVRRLVGHVVINAKKKDGTDWQRPAFQGADYKKRYFARIDPSQMQPLVVFVGGGGAPSTWYQKAISSTYKKFQHSNAGIPPYELIEVPKPADLDMRQIPAEHFRRFAISYGLSIPLGEGPDVRLPSQVPDAIKPQKARASGVVDYADSKDVYD